MVGESKSWETAMKCQNCDGTDFVFYEYAAITNPVEWDAKHKEWSTEGLEQSTSNKYFKLFPMDVTKELADFGLVDNSVRCSQCDIPAEIPPN